MKPFFEVLLPTTDAAQRRLVELETARALLGLDESEDAVLAFVLDAVSAQCAQYCNLARAGTLPVTLGRELLRATWQAQTMWPASGRADLLYLPWRVPLTSVVTISEDGTELEAGDWEDMGGCVLRRIGGTTACWSGAAVVVEYEAGWMLGSEDEVDPVPADLQHHVLEQVRMQYASRGRDPAIRSENIPDVWSGSYAVAGGNSIGESGLMLPLEAALAPFRGWSI